MSGRRRKARPGPRPGGQMGTLRFEGSTWRLYYREPADETGHRRRRGVAVGSASELRSWSEAREAANRLIAKLQPRKLPPGSSPPWLEWCQRYCDLYVGNLTVASQSSIRSAIRRHIAPAFAPLRLHEVNVAAIQGWIAHMLKAGGEPTTIATRYRVVHRMLTRAALLDLAATPPPPRAIELPRKVVAREALAEKAFTMDEVALIIAAAPQPWRCFFSALAGAGLRSAEGLGLQWGDIDFNACVVHIRRSAVFGRLQDTKSARSRAPVPLSDELAAEFRGYRPLWKPNEAGLLFANARGKPLWSSGVRSRHLQPLLQKLAIREGLSCHSFRHFAAYQMLKAGAPLPAVRDALRHSSIVVTEKYAAAMPADTRAAVASLGKSLKFADATESPPDQRVGASAESCAP